MLAKAQKLTSQEVESAIKKGRRASSSLFSLSILPASESKISVIIPKKVARTSVMRHLYKRRIMAALSKCRQNKSLPHSHIVFTLRHNIANIDFKDICAHVNDILAKA